ncbi:relaxase/mobilization nuclease domain-containing protein [Chryseobacterium chendengshani]|uniref:conjugal transfer protein MobB n=1 Tax=Chryseobacterium sp. LJ668 TaxID=2864040 RepID=UPI001C68902B|nr:conjugal transfer protein MobB [Chryseobacterium sp. LJ668]MBW8523812.1 relaxase/mobilization nuclease domain-containing protein [Chryseobacterium sp. LJ668]QYK16755.1 relaxase/mobilization nuclease domain-containing protein [Chryseobacterium sp. LJ668]
MVAKIGRSSNLYGALAYNNKKVEREKGKILMTNNMIETTDGRYTVSQLAHSFDSYLAANRNTEKYSLHISLNPDPKDKVSDENFIDLAQDYMQKLGYGDQPYVVFKHLDIDRTHIHIVSVVIDEMGKKISDRFEKRKSMEICRELEKKYELVPAAMKRDQKYELLFRPVDYKAGDVKKQIASVIRHLPKYYQFRSLAEYNALISLFNITSEKVDGELQGKLQSGLLYFPLNEEGKIVGNHFKASLFGKDAGLSALEEHFLKCRESLKDDILKSHLKEVIANIMQSTFNENDFKSNLIRQGINTVIRRNSSGIMYGITFIDHRSKTVWNGSSLGKEFSSNSLSERWKNENLPENKKLSKEKNETLTTKKSSASLSEKPHLLFDFLETHQKGIPSEDGFIESVGGLFSFNSEGDHEEQEFAHRMRKRRNRKR